MSPLDSAAMRLALAFAAFVAGGHLGVSHEVADGDHQHDEEADQGADGREQADRETRSRILGRDRELRPLSR
jgi:hypothetical protein